MQAWVTLLTQPNYLIGVRTLRASLERSGSSRPLVVLVTDGIDTSGRKLLEDEGCLVRPVEAIRPGRNLEGHYANARFAEVWTKLAAWGLTEFDRVVALDADMLVTQNMDELFALDLAADSIAACHACRCNPNRIASYPPSWVPENCFYTYCRGVDHTSEPAVVDNYLNGGFLVLRPDLTVLHEMLTRLAALDDLSPLPVRGTGFPERLLPRTLATVAVQLQRSQDPGVPAPNGVGHVGGEEHPLHHRQAMGEIP